MQRRSIIGRILCLITPVLLYLLITIAVQLLATVLSYPVYEYATELTALSALCTIPLFVLMIRKDNKARTKNGTDKRPLRFWLLLICAGISLTIFLNGILMISGLMGMSESYQETAQLLYAPSFPVQLVCVGLVVPIAEELLFCGLIYQRLRDFTCVFVAILLSAAFFGVFHGNLVQGIYGFCAGLFLAYACEKFHTIAASILVHMVMNITSCVLTQYDGFVWVFETPGRFFCVMIVLAGVLGATIGVLCSWKK